MNSLITLSKVISEQDGSLTAHLNYTLARSPKLKKLYRLIISGQIKNDDQAVEHLYPGAKSKSSLSELKRRLKAKLVDSILFIDPASGKTNELHAAYNQVSRIWVAARQLQAYQHSQSFIDVAKGGIKLATKYEFSDIIYHLSRMMISYFSVHTHSKSEFTHYSNLLVTSRRTMLAEEQAEHAYFKLYLFLSESQRSRKSEELTKHTQSFRSTLEEYPEIESNRYLQMIYLHQIFCAEITCNHHSAILLCSEAISKLKRKPFKAIGSIFSLELRLIANLIKVGELHRARVLVRGHNKSTIGHGHSWYTLNIYGFILECHDRQYDQASSLLNYCLSNKNFKSISDPLKQLWHICAAFHAFLFDVGWTTTQASSQKPFRIYKFLNDVPMYSKDKRGMNITILIIHVLFLMWQKKYNKADDRITSLKAYSHRYLRDDANFRSNCFIKMLVELARADFNHIRGQRYAQKYIDRLREVPLSKSRQGLEIEIIPYEHLWEMILDMCPSQ